jgi:glutamyl-tRNA reductase
MRLQGLRLVHLPKLAKSAKTADLPESFCLDSCQRTLWVDFESKRCEIAGSETYFGADAYQFLLRVASGLESQVVGETDIFGQLKEAWKNAKVPVSLRVELSPWIQKIFEDTKEIRTQYLQNLGGSSYGSLLRKLLREKRVSRSAGPCLLIGAGQLAESLAPYLLQDPLHPELAQDLWISNRNPEKAQALAALLKKQNPTASIRVLKNAEEELAALPEATCVVLAIPVEIPPSGMDEKRIAILKHRPGVAVIHLGARAGESSHWEALSGGPLSGSFDSLDSLFEIEKSLSRARSVQIERARAACRERAKLRALGGSFVAHGWEDLAVFA